MKDDKKNIERLVKKGLEQVKLAAYEQVGDDIMKELEEKKERDPAAELDYASDVTEAVNRAKKNIIKSN